MNGVISFGGGALDGGGVGGAGANTPEAATSRTKAASDPNVIP